MKSNILIPTFKNFKDLEGNTYCTWDAFIQF